MATIIGSTNSIEWSFKLDTYETSWDINTNESRVRVDVYIGRTRSRGYCGGNFSGSINVDGQVQNFSGSIGYPTYINAGEWLYTGITKDFNVGHNSDGSKYAGVSASWGANFTPSSASASGGLTLTTIPRASTITATSANIGEVSKLSVTRKSNNFTHTIRYVYGNLAEYIKSDGTTSSTAEKMTNTSIDFIIPTTWYTQIPNAQIGYGTIYIDTYSGDTKIGNTQTTQIIAKVDLVLNKPTLTASVIDTNTNAIALTGDNKRLIRGISQPQVTYTATAKNSAIIKQVKINNNVVTSSPYTFTIIDDYLKVTALDTREIPNEVIPDNTIVNYFEPNFTFSMYRKEPTSSYVKVKFEGTFYNGSFGKETNVISLAWNYRKTNDTEWESPTNIPLVLNQDYKINGNNVYSGTGDSVSEIEIGGQLEYNDGWTVGLFINDKLVYEELTADITKGIPVYWWDDKDVYIPDGFLKIKDNYVDSGIVAWENPNPSQPMGTGIEINLPTDDWDVIKIYYINYINFQVVESVEGLKGRDVQLSSLFYYPSSQSSFAGSRRLEYINDTKYIIKNAIAMVDQNVFVTQEVRPDWLIPLKIVLYKTGWND